MYFVSVLQLGFLVHNNACHNWIHSATQTQFNQYPAPRPWGNSQCHQLFWVLMPPWPVQTINLIITHTGNLTTTVSTESHVQTKSFSTPVEPNKDSVTESETEEDWIALQQALLQQQKHDQVKKYRPSNWAPQASGSASMRSYRWKRGTLSLVSSHSLVLFKWDLIVPDLCSDSYTLQ
jgi:hypothetical protein